MGKLSEVINIKNVCERIQKSLNRKTESTHSKLLSDLSNKDSGKASISRAQGNIILNSIININITNISNPKNNNLLKNTNPKGMINKTSNESK